jgi:hypothetical protein
MSLNYTLQILHIKHSLHSRTLATNSFLHSLLYRTELRESHCDWRSVSLSWYRAPSGVHDQILELNWTFSPAYNISARITQKTPFSIVVFMSIATGTCLLRHCPEMTMVWTTENTVLLLREYMMRVLTSDGHFLHSHRLAKGLYATIHITLHGKKLPVLHTTPIPEDFSWSSYLYFRASMGQQSPISDDDVLLFLYDN